MVPDLAEAPLELLRQLVRAQQDGEAAVLDCIAASLAASGCGVTELEYKPDQIHRKEEFASPSVCGREPRRILLGRLPGRPSLPSLLIFAHPDCEPVGALEGWNRNPFAGELEDGRVFGWGVADDLAGCAAGLVAVASLAASASDRGEVALALAPSKRYARGAAVLFGEGFRFDAALYLHPAESGMGLGEIKTATPGQLEFRMTVRGEPPDTTEPAHTALSHLAQNPVAKALSIAAALRAWSERRAADVRHPRMEAIAGRSTNLHVSRLSSGDGVPLSRVPTRCEIGGALSMPPGEDVPRVMRGLEDAVAEVCESDEWLSRWPVEVEWLSGAVPAETPEGHPFVSVASRAITCATGSAPKPNLMHVASDIRHPIALAGIPCVGMGCLCGNLGQNGYVDEWVDVRSFRQMIQVAMRIAEDWASGTGRSMGSSDDA